MIFDRLSAKWPMTREPILFAVVGLTNTLAYFAVGLALHYLAGMPAFLASGVAYLVAVIVNFLGNALLTFEHGQWNSPRQIFAHLGLYAIGLLYNMAVIHLLDVTTGSPFLGFVVLALTWPVIAFFASKLFVFVQKNNTAASMAPPKDTRLTAEICQTEHRPNGDLPRGNLD